MEKFWKHLKRFLGIAGGLYGLLFLVFFFDLDGKLLYYVYEPWIQKHYENIKGRRDITDIPYGMPKDE